MMRTTVMSVLLVAVLSAGATAPAGAAECEAGDTATQLATLQAAHTDTVDELSEHIDALEKENAELRRALADVGEDAAASYFDHPTSLASPL